MNTEKHSVWNGRFKTNPKEGKLFLEILDLIASFDGMPVDEILELCWGESRDALELLIKKSNKREKKKESKFVAKDLKRPPSALNLYQQVLREELNKKGEKFDIAQASKQYKALSEKERVKYQKKADELKAKYETEYERMRNEAINRGEFPADKPKKSMSAYLLYVNSVRASIAEKYKDEVNRKDVNANIVKDAGRMWKELSAEEKKPFEDLSQKAKIEYTHKLKEWEAQENKRLGRSDAIKVATSGKKATNVSTVQTTKVKQQQSDHEEDEEEQSDQQSEHSEEDHEEEDHVSDHEEEEEIQIQTSKQQTSKKNEVTRHATTSNKNTVKAK